MKSALASLIGAGLLIGHALGANGPSPSSLPRMRTDTNSLAAHEQLDRRSENSTPKPGREER